jgi:hypothetical protein
VEFVEKLREYDRLKKYVGRQLTTERLILTDRNTTRTASFVNILEI